LFCSFGEIIHEIGLEPTNANDTTCGRSIELCQKIIFSPFC